MNTAFKTGLVCLAVSMIIACSSAVKVTSDYDKAANFSQYKTFALNKVEPDKQSISQLNQDRITNAVRAEMTRKGYQETSSNPDLLVHTLVVLKDRKSLSSNTDYYGYGGMYRPWAWGGGVGVSGYTTYNVQDYKDGSLIIDVADSKTQKLVWEGIGNKEIDKPLKDPDKEIPEAVTSIMKSFPGGTSQ